MKYIIPSPLERINCPEMEEASVHSIPGILFTMEKLREAVEEAKSYLLSLQHARGYWVFDLEADTTIPSEYILLGRFLGREMDPLLRERFRTYLLRRQLPDGGWPLYTGGSSNISTSVKAYFALKLLGDASHLPHMERARRLILTLGGAERCNVFTRITLALFGQVPWRTTPAMPVEIMLLPKWFFFHLHKVSYWSRTVIVPLLILYAKRPVCPLGSEEQIRELFLEPPEELRHLDRFIPGNPLKNAFLLMDRLLKRCSDLMPRSLHRRAVKRAEQWTLERMQGEGGLGAIFPAMANAVMALKALDFPEDDPDYVRGIRAIEDLLIVMEEEAYCQPCVSPIWDTCLSISSLLEAELPSEHRAIGEAVDWLFDRMVLQPGDWTHGAPDLEPGGWAFQFENVIYPDVDDTAMVAMAILRFHDLDESQREKLSRAAKWILGMQNSDGGWGAFDIDNHYLYLNQIPFADHGALVDPSTSDLTARCVELLCMLGYDRDFPPISRALRFLREDQDECGGWFGRWGVNYLYGTWSVLMAMKRAGEDMDQPYIRKAVQWLKLCQNKDYGWGENCHCYVDLALKGKGESTPSQTAWALLGLMAAGEIDSPEVQRGVHYLISTRKPRGGWDESLFTGTGFPGVFYLRYHGYRNYFPLWALGVYYRLRTGKKTRPEEVLAKRLDPFLLPVQKDFPWIPSPPPR
jgi:squalene-hopene/tetraprenyl-beta-curcumene cyclase